MVDFKKLNGRGNFYFLRHGESDGNNAGVIQGRRDYPLSENGQIQARRTGAWFKEKNIDLILTAPLARTKQTAEIVAQVLGKVNIQTDENLNEIDTGIFTGLTLPDVQAKYPGEWKRFQRESWEAVPEAERIKELMQRVGLYWDTLANFFRAGERNILSVTHSGILQWLIKATLSHTAWMPLFPMSNCGICHFSVDNCLTREKTSYHYEWTHINFHPLPGRDEDGSLFLKPHVDIKT